MQRKLNINKTGQFRRKIRVGEHCYILSLAGLNDETNLSPAEIADVIEEQFAKS